MLIKRLLPIQKIFTAVASFIIPIMVGAQATPAAPVNYCEKGIHDFTDFLGYLIQCLIAGLVTRVIIALAVIVFMWGVLRYMFRAGQGDANYGTNLAKYLGYSLLAIFVMLSVWGIIFLVGGSLGIGQGGIAPIPQLPTSQ